MGSPSENEAGHAPEVTSDAPVAESKAESVNLDLFIDPVKERKMMRKFDVSITLDCNHFQKSDISRCVPLEC